MLSARCAESLSGTRGRLTARVKAPPATAGSPTSEPQPLALGRERDGVFYAPRVTGAAPLLIQLHGATGSGARTIRRVVEQAERSGTIVIAPDSRKTTWGIAYGDDADDVAFIDAALQKVIGMYAIDPRRITIAGFSDGASAALSLGLMNGDLFRNVVAFSPGFLRLTNRAQGRPRIFISHGDHDSILPVDGCGRRIARELRAAHYPVDYREFNGDHEVPQEILRAAFEWMST